MTAPNDEQVFLERVAECARSGLPLAEGLRAAANDTKSRKLSQQLRQLSQKLEAGASWEEVLQADLPGVRNHVLGILRAGIVAGDLGQSIDHLIDQDQIYHDTRRELAATLAYPVTLIGFAALLLLTALLWVIPHFDEIFSDFGTELPQATAAWIHVSRKLPTLLLTAIPATLGAIALIRVFGGPTVWTRLMSSLPVIGSQIHDAGVAQLLRLLAILLRQRVPLPDALELASSGAANRYVQRCGRWLADGVAAGTPMSQMIASSPRLPAVIGPLVEWGETHDALPEALHDATELLERRMQTRRSILNVAIGPLVLITLGILLGSLMLGMLMPLVSLIQNLT